VRQLSHLTKKREATADGSDLSQVLSTFKSPAVGSSDWLGLCGAFIGSVAKMILGSPEHENNSEKNIHDRDDTKQNPPSAHASVSHPRQQNEGQLIDTQRD
jgi:hypothetical protein